MEVAELGRGIKYHIKNYSWHLHKPVGLKNYSSSFHYTGNLQQHKQLVPRLSGTSAKGLSIQEKPTAYKTYPPRL